MSRQNASGWSSTYRRASVDLPMPGGPFRCTRRGTRETYARRRRVAHGLYVALVTDRDARASDRPRFPPRDEPERPPRGWRWWPATVAAVVIVSAVIVGVVSRS